jgi:LuxR family transcriptional regulator, maltose regulon positive regulatory protein
MYTGWVEMVFALWLVMRGVNVDRWAIRARASASTASTCHAGRSRPARHGRLLAYNSPMATPILATKLYIPPPRPNLVRRARLIARLNEGLPRKLALISAPAGFGKTTLLSEWLSDCGRPAAWLSLDQRDSDLERFLTYLVAALQTISASVGAGVLGALQSPQLPPTESILTALLNDITTTITDDFVLVLDDYHVLDGPPIDRALAFLLEHLPPHLHLVIATREDPALPLARLRAHGQVTDLRAADLRCTPVEAAKFLNEAMGLHLSEDDIATLEGRTEGWIAGLQIAALSLQGHDAAASFITSFSGSNRFVMDYLVEEVLQRQSERVQRFLLHTSILDRLCGPLCDAVLREPAGTGQHTLEYLERANLFIDPLDVERRWYRYHHLLVDSLRQRLRQSTGTEGQDEVECDRPDELHRRASTWYEDHGLALEAFHQAVAAHDVERAERLVEGEGRPLLFRGAVTPVLHWLESLPKAAMDARPSLWVMYASALTMTGSLAGVEEKLHAAEAAMQGTEPDDTTKDIVGQIAAIRAMLAVPANKLETIIAQSHRGLEYLHPSNLPSRTSILWTLGFASFLQGDRTAARRAYTEAISLSQAADNFILYIGATIGLGTIQEADTQLYLAAETYRRVMHLAGDLPQPPACEAHLGLAHVLYEWNDLDAAGQHGQQTVHLARQLENTDKCIAGEVALARLKLAQGDLAGAAALLGAAGLSARQHNLVFRLPEVGAAHVLTLLRQGNLTAAAHLAQRYGLPLSQARVHLAQGDTSAALAALAPWREEVEAKGWHDERLKVMVLQAVALKAHGELDKAVHLLCDALVLAEPGGFIRTFVDEGPPMARLITASAARGLLPAYIGRLLAAFEAGAPTRADTTNLSPALPSPAHQPLMEPLSRREREVLRLIAQGCSNQQISERLFLALSTVKGHNRVIFDKLQVQRRTEAVARARELGLV